MLAGAEQVAEVLHDPGSAPVLCLSGAGGEIPRDAGVL